jgi:hypothetical protein
MRERTLLKAWAGALVVSAIVFVNLPSGPPGPIGFIAALVLCGSPMAFAWRYCRWGGQRGTHPGRSIIKDQPGPIELAAEALRVLRALRGQHYSITGTGYHYGDSHYGHYGITHYGDSITSITALRHYGDRIRIAEFLDPRPAPDRPRVLQAGSAP